MARLRVAELSRSKRKVAKPVQARDWQLRRAAGETSFRSKRANGHFAFHPNTSGGQIQRKIWLRASGPEVGLTRIKCLQVVWA